MKDTRVKEMAKEVWLEKEKEWEEKKREEELRKEKAKEKGKEIMWEVEAKGVLCRWSKAVEKEEGEALDKESTSGSLFEDESAVESVD